MAEQSQTSTIDAAIVAIIGRELIEAALFCVDYYGVVLKSELPRSMKWRYVKYLTAAVIFGLMCGVAISLGIGYGVALAVKDEAGIELGVEIGEAVSRMIAAWFVIRLTIKIPTWFGISRYVDPDTPATRKISEPFSFATSLWWNIWREATEGGSLTALVTIFDNSMDALALSVGVGVIVGVGLGGGLALGGKFVSASVFGITAAVIAQFLAVGLVTGSVRAWEEVYQGATGNEGTAVVYEVEDPAIAATLQSFEFVGVSDSFTALTISVWIITMLLLTFIQIWHHFYGKPLVPRKVKLFCQRIKAAMKRPFQRCCKKKEEQEEPHSEGKSDPLDATESQETLYSEELEDIEVVVPHPSPEGPIFY